MKVSVILASILVLASAFFGTTHDAPIKPNAPDIPPGKYQYSCEGCVLDGDWVRCEGCKNADGQWVYADAPVSDCESFMNMDGRLICSRTFQDNAEDIPEGPYTDDCGGCSVFFPEDEPGRKYLACLECMDNLGNMHLNEIDITEPCDLLTNENGILTCHRNKQEL